MSFQANGYLPPGFHDWSLQEFEMCLVAAFPSSISRTDIAKGYEQLRTILTTILASSEHWLDGSFCTTKVDPNDLDLLITANSHQIDLLSDSEQKVLSSLVNGPQTKTAFRCDSYFCPTVPDNDPHAAFWSSRKAYWLKQFGFDRSGTAKGMVRLAVSSPSVKGPTI